MEINDDAVKGTEPTPKIIGGGPIDDKKLFEILNPLSDLNKFNFIDPNDIFQFLFNTETTHNTLPDVFTFIQLSNDFMNFPPYISTFSGNYGRFLLHNTAHPQIGDIKVQGEIRTDLTLKQLTIITNANNALDSDQSGRYLDSHRVLDNTFYNRLFVFTGGARLPNWRQIQSGRLSNYVQATLIPAGTYFFVTYHLNLYDQNQHAADVQQGVVVNDFTESQRYNIFINTLDWDHYADTFIHLTTLTELNANAVAWNAKPIFIYYNHEVGTRPQHGQPAVDYNDGEIIPIVVAAPNNNINFDWLIAELQYLPEIDFKYFLLLSGVASGYWDSRRNNPANFGVQFPEQDAYSWYLIKQTETRSLNIPAFSTRRGPTDIRMPLNYLRICIYQRVFEMYNGTCIGFNFTQPIALNEIVPPSTQIIHNNYGWFPYELFALVFHLHLDFTKIEQFEYQPFFYHEQRYMFRMVPIKPGKFTPSAVIRDTVDVPFAGYDPANDIGVQQHIGALWLETDEVGPPGPLLSYQCMPAYARYTDMASPIWDSKRVVLSPHITRDNIVRIEEPGDFIPISSPGQFHKF